MTPRCCVLYLPLADRSVPGRAVFVADQVAVRHLLHGRTAGLWSRQLPYGKPAMAGCWRFKRIPRRLHARARALLRFATFPASRVEEAHDVESSRQSHEWRHFGDEAARGHPAAYSVAMSCRFCYCTGDRGRMPTELLQFRPFDWRGCAVAFTDPNLRTLLEQYSQSMKNSDRAYSHDSYSDGIVPAQLPATIEGMPGKRLASSLDLGWSRT